MLFPCLITALCKQARVPKNKKIDSEGTLLATTDIRRIKAEYLRNEEYKARKKLADTTPVIDVEALQSKATDLGTKVGISSFFYYTFLLYCCSFYRVIGHR